MNLVRRVAVVCAAAVVSVPLMVGVASADSVASGTPQVGVVSTTGGVGIMPNVHGHLAGVKLVNETGSVANLTVSDARDGSVVFSEDAVPAGGVVRVENGVFPDGGVFDFHATFTPVGSDGVVSSLMYQVVVPVPGGWGSAARHATGTPWLMEFGRDGDKCQNGWVSSWAQWPNDGKGGFVCTYTAR